MKKIIPRDKIRVGLVIIWGEEEVLKRILVGLVQMLRKNFLYLRENNQVENLVISNYKE
jgi:hypothetical protein